MVSMQQKIRQPVVSFLGHVDHGKSSILEKIREISILKHEAGGITQTIKSYSISVESIKKICGDLLKKLKLKLKIPGLLFIDTPGHAAFNNLRKRGGNLADIAILVINLKEGVMDQTKECIEILKFYKTPFVVAANKIDLISKNELDTKIYEIVGDLSKYDIDSDRYDRIDDYTKKIAIIPCSAKTGEGIAELLMILTGLAQKYLEENLRIKVKGQGKGVVLEIKEEKGLGLCMDVIIYDGVIKKGDRIVIGGLEKPIITKVKSLFEPLKGKLKELKEVSAAIGVKINAPNIKDVVAGMPLLVIKDLEKDKKQVMKDVEEVLIETDKDGVVVKANSLGSLEAITGLLKEHKIEIKRAGIGNITKKDIAEAKSSKDLLKRVVLGFNVSGSSKEVKVITNKIIYKIIEDYEEWKEKESKKLESKALEKLVYPCKFILLPGCVFRQSNPAVFGVKILGGKLRTGTPLMKDDGTKVSEVKSMQLESKSITEAVINDEIAIAVPKIIIGRQLKENDIVYSDIPEDDFIKLKKLKKYLNGNEIQILKEIADIKRKKKAIWGI